MKIHIHVGVHKTATTYTQSLLHANRDKLHQAGIGFIGLWEFRSTFTENLMNFEPGVFRIEDHLPRFFEQKVPREIRGLLISEENLIGYCGGLVNSGTPFGTAANRLAHLRKLLAGHDVTLFCAVRDYHSFLASAYCEGLRNNQKFVTFETFRSRLQWDKMNWAKLLARFEQSLQPERTVVWRYEDFRSQAGRILNAMCFDQNLDLVPPTQKSEYQSFSKATVDALEVIAKHLDPEIAGRLIHPIGKALPKNEINGAFEPWPANDVKMLQRLYQSHCSAIPPKKFLFPPMFGEPDGQPD
jgi:hypothetical protein